MPLSRAEKREFWMLTHPEVARRCKTRKQICCWAACIICFPIALPIRYIHDRRRVRSRIQWGHGDMNGGRRIEIERMWVLRDRKREEDISKHPPLTWGNGDPKKTRTSRFWKSGIGKQEERAQAESPLFNKLPAELRLLVWKYVLADQEVLHIWSSSSGPTVLECKSDHQAYGQGPQTYEDAQEHARDPHLRCFEYFLLDIRWQEYERRPNGSEEVDDTRLGAVPLLSTCRRIYNETLPILYGYNTFCFFDDDDFVSFARRIPRQHLAIIRSLVLYKCRDNYAWKTAADYLDLMSELQTCEFTLLQRGRWQRAFKIETSLDWMLRLKCGKSITVHVVQRWGDLKAIYPPFPEYDPRLNTLRCTRTWVVNEGAWKCLFLDERAYPPHHPSRRTIQASSTTT